MRASLSSGARARLAGIVKRRLADVAPTTSRSGRNLGGLPVPAGSPGGGAGILGTAAGFANGGVDPFSFYYGYYLPHQAAIAAQPTPLDTINQITAQRQYTALSERQGLYDPISPYGEEDLDPNRPYSAKRGGERVARPYSYPVTTSNIRGTGPALYYARTARYYPQLRAR